MPAKPKHLEDAEQRIVIEWSERVRLPPSDDLVPGAKVRDYLFASANGGVRGGKTKAIKRGGKTVRVPIEAAKMRGLGVTAGDPDLRLDLPRRGYHGLRIEMKKRRERFGTPSAIRSAASPAQTEILARMRRAGYVAEVCYGADEAIVLLCDYLGLVAPAACEVAACRGRKLGYTRTLQ